MTRRTIILGSAVLVLRIGATLARIIHEAFYCGRRSSASSGVLGFPVLDVLFGTPAAENPAFTRICSTLGGLATNFHE
ncbi:MAG: hypothetical protein IPK07_05345 [Deltaproteobacteria bacterium]|nr:hypothetical protein [Deltaproteobacteria bacterium]